MKTNNKLDVHMKWISLPRGRKLGEIGKRRMPTSNLSSLRSDVTTN
jgi:hypothetical protein